VLTRYGLCNDYNINDMRKIKDKKELIKLASYIIMGDGGVYMQSKKGNAYFMMNMIQKNDDYIELCKDILENISGMKKTLVDRGEGRQNQYRLFGRAHPIYTKLRQRINTGNYKGIDPHALKMLDYEALSFLYMSDGSFHTYLRPEIGMKNPSYKVTLNLKRLSYGDLFILKKALKEKLDIEWNIHKQNQYYYLSLRMKDIDKFMNGIRPYITESFMYKILDEKPQEIG
jgi:hypothetical protein